MLLAVKNALLIPFTIATERIKYLGINLPKQTKELCRGNYKTLMKEIKDYINSRKNQYFETDYNTNCKLCV